MLPASSKFQPLARTGARLLLVGVGGTGLFVALGLSALVLLAPRTAAGELVTNVRLPLGLCSFVTAVPLVIYRRHVSALLAIALGGWHVAPELALLVGPVAASGPGREMRIVGANLLYGRAEPAKLFEFLVEHRADLVVLSEVTEPNTRGTRWRELFDRWRERFPYQAPVEGVPFSIMLLSRHPLDSVEGYALEPPVWIDGVRWTQRRILVEADVRLPARTIKVFATHFPIPSGSWSLVARTQLIDRIARERGSGPTIVVGDLNTTRTSPLFDDLLGKARLRDSREGFGPCLSWRHPQSPFHLIAIDHVLVSEEIGVLERGLGPEIGSDHRPICAVLRIPELVAGRSIAPPPGTGVGAPASGRR